MAVKIFQINQSITMTKPILTLLYDGQCPLCRREIAWMRTRNGRGLLGFQDIHAADFEASALGVSVEQLMAEIHGINTDGSLIKGIDVFAIAYSAVGFGWLAAAIRSRWLRPVFKCLYAWFARYRRRLKRTNCQTGQCGI